MASIGSLVADMRLQSAAFSRDLGKATKAVNSNTAQMRKSMRQVETASRNVTKQLKTLRVSAAALGGALALREFNRSFTQFETTLQRTVGLVGIAQEEVNKFRKEILQLGPAVGKGPSELAEGLFFITSAGLEGARAMDALTVSAKASAAGLGETKQVADAVTSAMNAYATSNLTAQAATDVLVSTVREGKLEASELAGSIGQVLAISESAGVRFDEVGASVAALTRIGIGTSEAVTGLRGALVALVKESSGGAEQLAALGTSYADLRASIREQGLLKTLTDLKAAIGDNETALVEIFGRVEAANTVLALTGANADQVREIFNNLADSSGSLDSAFAAITGTAEFKMNSALSTLSQQMDRMAATVIPALATAATTVADNFDLITAALAAFVAFKATGFILNLAQATHKLGTAIKGAAVAQVTLNAVMATNPIGAVATGVATLVGGYLLLKDKTFEIGEATIRVGDLIAAIWSAATLTVRAFIGELINVGAVIGRLITGDFAGAAAAVKNVGAAVTAEITNVTDQFRDLDSTTSKVSESSEKTEDALAQLKNVLTEVSGGTGDLASKVTDSTKALQLQSAQIAKQIAAIAVSREAYDAVTREIDIQNEAIRLNVDLSSAQGRAWLAAARQAQGLAMQLENVSAARDQAAEVKKSTAALRTEANQTKLLVRALERGERAYRDMADAIDIQNEAAKVGVDLASKQGREWAEAARQSKAMQRELEDLKDVQAEAARAAKDHAAEQKRLREEQQRLVTRPFINAVEGIQRSFVDLFENIFSGGVDSFKSLGKAIKETFIKLAAEIAALLVFRPIVAGLVGASGLTGLVGGASGAGGLSALAGIPGTAGGSILSAGGGGAGGGGIGVLGSLGSLLQGVQVKGATAVGNLLLSAGTSTKFASNVVSNLSGVGAPIAGALGGFLGDAVFGGQGGLGGGLGATAGFAVGGPIGSAIGGFLGGALGGLFGGKPSRKTSHAVVGVSGGRLQPTVRGGSGGDISGDTARKVAEIVKNTLGADQANKIRGNFGIIQVANANKTGGQGFFLSAVPSALRVGTAFESVSGTNKVGFNTQQELLSAVTQLTQRYKSQTDAAKAASDALKEQKKAQEDSTLAIKRQVRANLAQASGTIVDFLRVQSLSETSSLNPTQRLSEAQRQFTGLLERVRGGEANLAGALTQSAGSLLSIGRENFASTVDFSNLEGFVRSNLLNVSEQLLSDNFFDAQVEATRQQTNVLSGDLQTLNESFDELRREMSLLRQQMAA